APFQGSDPIGSLLPRALPWAILFRPFGAPERRHRRLPMAYVDFVNKVHRSTKRDYLKRVTEHDKAVCAELACKFDKDYWDGDRHTGYGGYRYDGRWRSVAEDMARHYGLKPGMRVLDVGCGKGFLLY